jgi:hypothetical protein
MVAAPLFPPSSLYNSVAEIWFYHIAAAQPALVVHVPGPLAIVGMHQGPRLTNHWERLGVASLAVQEAFARSCPDTPAASHARQLAAEKAFLAWRRLPRGFSPEFCARQLGLWYRLRTVTRLDKMGGHWFAKLARILGPMTAARVLRCVQNTAYARIRTMDDTAFQTLLASLPAP